MATPAQVTANRANAQSSTGPRSVEGKAASSRNSLKLGLYAKSVIIPGEDPADLEELTTQFFEEFDPATAVEEHLVQAMVHAVWMQRRCDRIEAAYLNARIAAQPETAGHALGAAIMEDAAHGNVLHKLFHRRQAAERDWSRALTDLTAIQGARFQHEAQAEAEALALSRPPAPQNRVRFSAPPQPSAQRAPEPPENLALRL
jgi:hypothetical protein